MALLSKDHFFRIEKERNNVHNQVKTTYTIFTIDEEKYLQIDTYGKSTRKFQDKISQSFQLDRSAAKVLYKLLAETFNFE